MDKDEGGWRQGRNTELKSALLPRWRRATSEVWWRFKDNAGVLKINIIQQNNENERDVEYRLWYGFRVDNRFRSRRYFQSQCPIHFSFDHGASAASKFHRALPSFLQYDVFILVLHISWYW